MFFTSSAFCPFAVYLNARKYHAEINLTVMRESCLIELRCPNPKFIRTFFEKAYSAHVIRRFENKAWRNNLNPFPSSRRELAPLFRIDFLSVFSWPEPSFSIGHISRAHLEQWTQKRSHRQKKSRNINAQFWSMNLCFLSNGGMVMTLYATAS